MREWKDKDVVAGLIVIIILGLIALFLLIRREINNSSMNMSSVTKEESYSEVYEEEFDAVEEAVSNTGEEVFIETEDVKEDIREENVTKAEDKKKDSIKTEENKLQAIPNKASVLAGTNQKPRKHLYSILGKS